MPLAWGAGLDRKDRMGLTFEFVRGRHEGAVAVAEGAPGLLRWARAAGGRGIVELETMSPQTQAPMSSAKAFRTTSIGMQSPQTHALQLRAARGDERCRVKGVRAPERSAN
jgi:hypothetical protein